MAEFKVGQRVADRSVGGEGVIIERYAGIKTTMRGMLLVQWDNGAGQTWEYPSALEEIQAVTPSQSLREEQEGNALRIFGDSTYGFSGHINGPYDPSTYGDLLPCPFCGEEGVTYGQETGLELCNTHTSSYWIECKQCEAQAHGECPDGNSGPYPTADEARIAHERAIASAVEWWNRRSQPTSPSRQGSADQVESLLDALRTVRDALTKEGERGAIVDTLWVDDTCTVRDCIDHALDGTWKCSAAGVGEGEVERLRGILGEIMECAPFFLPDDEIKPYGDSTVCVTAGDETYRFYMPKLANALRKQAGGRA